MKQQAAPTSRSIQIVTVICLVMTGVFFVGACFRRELLWGALFLGLLEAYCYWFWTPIAYELDQDALTVVFRRSRKRFAPVIRCSPVRERPGFGVRLWGNSGLFAGAGYFWSKRYGLFQAYVTRAKHTEWVLVETRNRKVIISPGDPASFVPSAEKTAGQV